MRIRRLLIFNACCLCLLGGCHGTPPTNLGLHNGQLAPCPSSPNCVSDASTDPTHAIAPFHYSMPQPEAKEELKRVILAMPRTNIVEETPGYVRAEFMSALWRFVDDVEFSFDDSAKLVHIRSASRLGKGDLGVNRKRLETIRAKLNWK